MRFWEGLHEWMVGTRIDGENVGAREEIGMRMAGVDHLRCCRPLPCVAGARVFCGPCCGGRGDKSLRSGEEQWCGGEAGA
jgi:hypothetical protein